MAIIAAASDKDSDETLSICRKKKRIRTAADHQGGDLLSSLPDSIISLVFSYLTIKEILRTSAVSRGWRRLWTKTPAICYASNWEEYVPVFDFKGFASSLNRVFLICPMPSIRRFCLEMVLYRPCRKDTFDLWLKLAVAHQVVDLAIDVGWRLFSYRSTYVLPEFLFGYSGLTTLHVRCCKFTLCASVSWKSLRILRIGGVEMNNDTIDAILRGCPVLEHLWLEKCWGMTHLNIDSREVRELVIDGCTNPKLYRSLRGEDAEEDGFLLEVTAPHLVSLQILGDWFGIGKIRLDKVSSLAEVKLDFALRTFRHLQMDVSEMFRGLLGRLACVGSLTVGSRTIQDLNTKAGLTKGISLCFECSTLVLHAFEDEPENLELTALSGSIWNVKRLIINFDSKCPARSRDHDLVNIFGYQRPQRETLKHLAARLLFIEINGFPAMPGILSKQHRSLLKFLLRNTLKLEKLIINAKTSKDREAATGNDYRPEELLKVERDVSNFKRVSEGSEVIFNCSSPSNRSSRLSGAM